MGEEFLSVSSL